MSDIVKKDEVILKNRYYIGDKVWIADPCGIAVKCEIVSWSMKGLSIYYQLDEPYFIDFPQHLFLTRIEALMKLKKQYQLVSSEKIDDLEDWRERNYFEVASGLITTNLLNKDEKYSFIDFLRKKAANKVHLVDYILKSDLDTVKK